MGREKLHQLRSREIGVFPEFKMRGSIVPLITPLNDDGSLDTFGLKNLIRYQLVSGTHGLFVAGTTGEFDKLPYYVRMLLISKTVEFATNKVTNKQEIPVYAGISHKSLNKTIEIAKYAQNAGANFLVLIPGFCRGKNLREVIDAVTSGTTLPVVLYNPPVNRFEGVLPLTPDIMAEIQNPSQIAGIKDSTGNRVLFARWLDYAKEHPEFVVATGSTKNLDQSRNCFVISAANTHPRFFAEYSYDPNDQLKLSDEEIRQYLIDNQTNSVTTNHWWAERRLQEILELKRKQGLDNPDAIKQWWWLRGQISSPYPFEPVLRPLPYKVIDLATLSVLK